MPRLHRIHKNIFVLGPRGNDWANANINILKYKKPVLIDCGSSFDTNIKYLKKILRSLDIDTIDKIIITHSHIDHCQNAGALAQEFGSEIIAHKNAIPILKYENRGSLEAFEYWDLIEETYPRIFRSRFSWLYRRLIVMGYNFFVYRRAKRVRNVTAIAEGDVIDLGDGALQVLFTPGHSNDSICLLEREKKILFTGDMIPWTPYIHSTINDFRHSISKILQCAEQFDVKVMVRGHQKPQNASTEKANYRMFLHDMDIAEKRILKLLEKGPLTAHYMLPYIFRRTHFQHELIYRVFMRTQQFWISKYLRDLENKNVIKSFNEGTTTKYILV